MPDLQEIEQFKNILNELGDEPEILAERDEEIEDIPPPEQGLPEGLSDLLETPDGAPAEAADEGVAAETGEPAPAEEMPFPTAPPEQDVDLSDLLGGEDPSGQNLPEGIELPEESARDPEEPGEGIELPEESIEAFELPEAPFEEPAEPGEPSGEQAEGPGEPIESFELPEGVDLSDLFPTESTETEETEEGPEAAAAPEEVPAEEFSLEDFEFEMPEGEAAPEQAVPEEQALPEGETLPEEQFPEAGTPIGEVASEEVDLSDLFPTESPETEEEAEQPVGEPIEEPSDEAAGEQSGEPPAEEEFTIPPGLLEPQEPTESAEEVGAPEEELELPEEFVLPAEEEAQAAPEEAAEEASAEAFDFDLSDFQMPEEVPEGGAEQPEVEGPGFEEPIAEEPSVEEPVEEEAQAEPEGTAEEAPVEAFDFELPEEEAPTAEGEISAEELPEMPGLDLEEFDIETPAAPEEEETAEEAAFEIPEFEIGEEIAPAEGTEEPVAPDEEFEVPGEFVLPEEQPEGESPAEPTDEEAEFLKVLQDQILPEGEAAAEQPAEAPPVEEAFEAFAEMPPEEAVTDTEVVPEATSEGLPGEPAEPPEAPPEEPTEEPVAAPPAEQVPEEVALEAEAAFPEGEQVDLESPIELPEGAEEYDLDEFSLEGLGEPFGVEEEAAAAPPSGEEEIPTEVPVVEEQFPEEIAVPGAGELTFTNKQFSAIKRSLSLLPRNLKIAIEELIVEKGLKGEELRSLLALLIDGAAPSAIAEQVSQLTGQRIVLPKFFERLSGVAFEERRRTFAYAFRENIIPILRVVLLSLLVLGLLGFLGHRYVYRPLYANYLYRQGYGQIAKERYGMANDNFDRATSVWAFKNWFLRYAKGFTDKRQFQLAAEKYEQLLRRFPRDRQGNLAYAGLLTFHLAGYEKADGLLREVLEADMRDYDALLAQGDNYLEWAREDESRYADARFAYASIIDYYGEKNEVLMRMLRYLVRTDKYDETRTLKAYLDEKGSMRVDPDLHASVLSELAGYWIDKGNYDSVPGMLFEAMEREMNQPNIHYQLARYYRHVQEPREEETALKAAIELLERMQPLDKRHLFMIIDSYNRRGETFWRKEEYLDAEEYFQKAIERIEDVQNRRIFGQEEAFGLAYKNYGDLYYYVSRDLEPALDLYLKALNNRYETPDLNYKIGYIHYAADRYEEALLAFSKVVDQRPSGPNALYSLGNSLYQRGYYSSAQGFYLRLLNLLEAREERIPFLQIYENPEHNALVEYIMKVYNNLGVTLKQLADRSRDPEKESKALVNMTFSSERFDLLTRDPVTVERGMTKNLAYLNQGGILYPTSDFELQIYTRLPIDLQASRF